MYFSGLLYTQKITYEIKWIETVSNTLQKEALFDSWNKYETLWVIWYHLCNFKNVKSTHGGVLLLAKLQLTTLLKVTLLHGCFSRFLNCTFMFGQIRHDK